jgi:hypothetical protein
MGYDILTIVLFHFSNPSVSDLLTSLNTSRENWIAAGEKRNAYIPSRPEEYYTRTGEWVSWVRVTVLFVRK